MAAISKPTRLPKIRGAFVWPWLLVSSIVHAAVFFTGFAIVGFSGVNLGEGGGTEDGHGFGGDAVDFVIAGPEADQPQGAMPMADDTISGTIPVAPEPEPEAVDEPEVVVAEEEPAPWRARNGQEEEEPEAVAVADVETRPGNDRESSVATDAEEAAAPGSDETPAGTGGDETLSGGPAGDPSRLILGSLGLGGDLAGARQAMLPNGGRCEDPAAGIWRAQRYDAGRRQWVRFTLRVRHDGSGALAGTITNHSYTGRPGNSVPGPCTAFGFDMTWRMQARGRYENGQMSFEARNPRLVRADCPDSGHLYYPDRFRGTVNPVRDTFEAVNNDGQAEFDQAYSFRRVSCGE